MSVRPTSVSLLLTTRCNGRCQMCKLWETSPACEMSFPQLKETLLDLKRFGIKDVCVLGGEPFLYKELFKLAEFIRKHFNSCSMVTNGSLINDANIDRVKQSFTYVEISLDADNKELFETIRGGYPFGSVIKTIELLNRYDIPHGATFLVQRDNVGRIRKTLELCEKLNTRFQLSFVRTNTHGVAENKGFNIVDTNMFEKEFKTIKSSKYLRTSAKSFNCLLDRLNGKKKNWRCVCAFHNVPVYPDGTVYPCDGIDRPMGNIFKSSFRDIYFSDDFTDLRKNILSGKSQECERCMHLCAINSSLNYELNPIFYRK